MDLEHLMLIEISQAEKDKYCMSSRKCEKKMLKKKKKTESKMVLSGNGGGG